MDIYNKTKNKKIQVYETLKQKIISNELKPGMPINEAILAENLGVSKTPIREALRELEQNGFVENFPGRGSIISNITQNEIRDIYEIREIIESSVAARAAARGGNEELRALRDELQVMLATSDDLDEQSIEWGTRETTHMAIVSSLENESLIKIYSQLMDRTLRIRNFIGERFTKRRYHDVLREHLDLLNAILSGDQQQASEKMVQHLTQASKFVNRLW